MSRFQYQSVTTPPAPNLSSPTGGRITSQKAGIWYFWLVNKNRSGYSLYSSVREVTIAANSSLEITIPQTSRTISCDVRETLIIGNRENNPQTACVLASYPGKDDINEPTPLPATIVLETDERLELNKSVSTNEELPSINSGAISGMRRYIIDVGEIVEYSEIMRTWLPVYPQTFNPYVTDTLRSLWGCDRDVTRINPILIEKYQYNLNGRSLGSGYLLLNDTIGTIESGRPILITVDLDGNNATAMFANKLIFRPLGHTNLTTRELDTEGIEDIGVEHFSGGANSVIRLKKALLPNWGYLFEVILDFEAIQLTGTEDILEGSLVTINASFGSNRAIYLPDGGLFGNVITKGREILSAGDGLIPIATSGSGKIGQYGFENVPEQIVPGIVANTPNQLVLITNTGTCYGSEIPPINSFVDILAVVGTNEGIGLPNWFENTISLPSEGNLFLELEIINESNIRSDYPDIIAGLEAAINASGISVYVQYQDDQIVHRFDVATSREESETIVIGDRIPAWTGEAIDGVESNFGLFASTIQNADVVERVGGATNLLNGKTVRIAIALRYTNTITSISHAPELGCIERISPELLAATIRKMLNFNFLGALSDVIVYVSTTGSIDNTGRTLNSPIPLAEAFSRYENYFLFGRNNLVFQLLDGTYTENYTVGGLFSNSTRSSRRLKLQGNSQNREAVSISALFGEGLSISLTLANLSISHLNLNACSETLLDGVLLKTTPGQTTNACYVGRSHLEVKRIFLKGAFAKSPIYAGLNSSVRFESTRFEFFSSAPVTIPA
ncbi:MAG: hypothetical protein ACRC2V_27235, partial [Xenococcaceae cyanobacterium]